MMDGRIGAIRDRLNASGNGHVAIMSHSSKKASVLYSPFRSAVESTFTGDRKHYQHPVGSSSVAMRALERDVAEGADIVMVKPGLPYLDLVWRVKEKFGYPVAVYNVSGEYAMLKAAAGNGWLDEKQAVLEMLTGFRRAGADIILTYWATTAAQWLK